MKRPKIGPTGQFPQGKMNADDKGELALDVSHDHDKGHVVMSFGTNLAWLGMGPSEAKSLAALLIHHANVVSGGAQ